MYSTPTAEVSMELAEYEALRAEILLRLTFQQQLLSYSLVTIGLLGPIFGLVAATGLVSTQGVLALLLLGPLMAAALQLNYLKQHIYIQTIGRYISTGLGAKLFGWERYLTRSLIRPHSTDRVHIMLDSAEAFVPSIAAIPFLLAFAVVLLESESARGLDMLTRTALVIAGSVEVCLVAVLLRTCVKVRRIGREKRLQAEDAASES